MVGVSKVKFTRHAVEKFGVLERYGFLVVVTFYPVRRERYGL